MSSDYRVDRIAELPVTSAFNLTDLIEKVNDPSGNPGCQKGTLAALITLIEAEIGGGGGGGSWGSITGTLADQTDLQAALNAKQDALGYTSYVALLTQSGVSAPTAIVLKNTLGGAVTWAYLAPGFYSASRTNAFPQNKVAIFTGGADASGFVSGVMTSGWIDASTLNFNTFDGTGAPTDGLLILSAVEIRVYP